MNRRDFFRNLLGGTAAVMIAPSILAGITFADYPTSPENIFKHQEGLWLFKDNELIAWSGLTGIDHSIKNEVIEISNNESGYVEYIPGKSVSTFDVHQLHITEKTNIDTLMMESLHMVFKPANDFYIESEVHCLFITLDSMLLETMFNESTLHQAALQTIGPITTIT